jgi:hypothetical protein
VPSEVVVRGERVRLRANQLIAWASVTPLHVQELSPAAAVFPVIVDTGHTHSFSIQQRHLVDWAGLRPDAMAVTGAAREQGRRLILRAARVWVRPNTPGTRDRLADSPPVLLAPSSGVAVYPEGVAFPRLPILGLRALVENNLVLVVNGHRREATLRTAYRWWPFAGR